MSKLKEICFWFIWIIAIISTLYCIKLERQIQTQKEYIECLEAENWEQFIELENYKENEFREMEEE